MADRRRFDSSHIVAGTPKVIFHFQLKKLFFTLAFVSCLLSIHCASFGQHSLNKRQSWRNSRPEYSVLSSEEPDNYLHKWLNYHSRPLSLPSTLKLADSERPSARYPYSASLFRESGSPAEVERQLKSVFRPPVLLNRPGASNEHQQHYTLIDDDLYQVLSGIDSISPALSNSDSSYLNSNSDSEFDYDSGFFMGSPLLGGSEKKSSQQPIELGDNFNLNYDTKVNPLYISSDQTFWNDNSHGHQKVSGVESENRQNQVLDDLSVGLQQMIARDEKQERPAEHRNFTTLLEDDGLETDYKEVSASNNDADDNKSNSKSPLSNTGGSENKNSNENSAPFSYGKVVSATNEAKTTGYGLSSMLGSIYNKFTSYLPFYHHKTGEEIGKTSATASKRDGTSSISYGNVVEHPDNATSHKHSLSSMFSGLYNKLASYIPYYSHQTTSREQQNNVRDQELSKGMIEIPIKPKVSNDANQEDVDELNGSSTKQSVSKLEPIDVRGSGSESIKDNTATSTNHDDKQTKDRKLDSVQAQAAKREPDNGVFLDSELEQAKVSDVVKGDDDNTSNNINNSMEDDKNVNSDDSIGMLPIDEIEIKHSTGKNGKNGEQKVSSLRQSSLIVPFKSSDHLLVQTTNSQDGTTGGSLLGKYIYAPEQHYYLNANQFDTTPSRGLGGKDNDLTDQDEQLYSHRSFSRRLHPGDDVYGSYSGLRPLYASQAVPHEALGLVSSKANDMYFLVMVSAFCVMAIAVVLAAGLFAYRVQQNRKSTSESDYPTYGVVGPNNMNGKCGGAAAFVGGYFGSSTSGSKNGSTKHLPDIYSGSGDSGITTSCKSSNNKKATNDQANHGSSPENANNRTDFMANQNAARMYHYQHQKQQMIISDRSSNGRHTSASDLDSEDENDDGSYTVYECPGLASAHEMEIKNPLFNDDQTP